MIHMFTLHKHSHFSLACNLQRMPDICTDMLTSEDEHIWTAIAVQNYGESPAHLIYSLISLFIYMYISVITV